MKRLLLFLLPLIAFSACNESITAGKRKISDKVLSYDTTAFYRRMNKAMCNCLSRELENNKPSIALDTCFKIITEKFSDTLKSIGVDPLLSPVENHLVDHINWLACGNMFHLAEQERIEEEAKLLLVKGQFVSQKKLVNGEYEIILLEDKTGEQKKLKSKTPFPEGIVKDQDPGYELTVEYEVVKNKETGKDELYVKKEGKLYVIGAVKF